MKKILVVVVLLVSFSSVFALVDLKSKEYDYGFMGGFWLSGDVDISGFTAEKDGTFLLRGFVDAYLIPKLAVGVYVNFSPASIEGYDVTMMEFGGSIKPKFFVNEDMAIKPGLGFGYRSLSGEDEEADADGMGVNLSVEVQKAMETMILSFEGGFLAQPAGGNEWVDITWSPIIYIGAGLTF